MKKHMITLLALLTVLVTLVLSSFAVAEDWKVTGTILDEETKAPISGVVVKLEAAGRQAITDAQGAFTIVAQRGNQVLTIEKKGYQHKRVAINHQHELEISLRYMLPRREQPVVDDAMEEVEVLEEVVTMDMSHVRMDRMNASGIAHGKMYAPPHDVQYPNYNTEEYATIHENIFHTPQDEPLSTFSIDVDAASYSNMRRFVNQGQLPPKDAVRIEEMINYFNYAYHTPEDDKPLLVNTETIPAPWNPKHQLVQVGIKGKEIEKDQLPASNIVFLLDVSGSMNQPNKLPLLKSAYKMLVQQLRDEDRVAIVVYAGAAGMVLPSTSGEDKSTILKAIDELKAGGSTAGGAGIELAYKIAVDNFIEGGNNRVILATDGDFNTGASSNAQMERRIEQKREAGVCLTVLGVGMGNSKDSKMEILADKGNGNYAYIDTMKEAKKVLVSEFGGTLFTIAKDVKIQVEFNPAEVQAYRLIGYENRKLNKEDFNNDKKDAGELGAGHTVTALYEIIPVGVESSVLSVDPLKYQQTTPTKPGKSVGEWMTVKVRYKAPDGDKSELIAETITAKSAGFEKSTDNIRWSSTVAAFGMMLRQSEFAGDATYASVLDWAKEAKGTDEFGYRSEMIQLIEMAGLLQGEPVMNE
ncbi:MAG: von Willebrand factor type A domain-containing protein [Cyclobacteriaceae bacterium]